MCTGFIPRDRNGASQKVHLTQQPGQEEQKIGPPRTPPKAPAQHSQPQPWKIFLLSKLRQGNNVGLGDCRPTHKAEEISMNQPKRMWWYLLAGVLALTPVGLRALTWARKHIPPVDPGMARAGEVLF